MASANSAVNQNAVAVGLEELRNGEHRAAILKGCAQTDVLTENVDFALLEEAFGSASLGIIVVKDLPSKFHTLRHKLLSYSSALASLSPEQLGMYPLSDKAYCI
jgi:hypothetical protein